MNTISKPLAAAVLITASVIPTVQTSAEPGSSQQWAVLIGIEQYQGASRLRHTINDVVQIANTLVGRGGFTGSNILTLLETHTNAERQPNRANILMQLPQWLAKTRPQDTVMVYFSGHGFRDRKDGKLYLAPIDCDPTRPAESCIAIDWLRRQLAGCPAKSKLLVLDACHAGSEKSVANSEAGVSARELGAEFEDLPAVVTLASSKSTETSQIWDEKQQSLFSYWFNQGLKGHADCDDNGAVTIDELYRYVHRNVTFTAATRMPRPQTPVRIVRSGTIGVPTVIDLLPVSLKRLLDDMAQQVAWGMEERQLPQVGVLEFTSDTKLGELLGADFGVLGRYCADNLQERLTDYAAAKFSVVSRARVQRALTDQGFQLEDLGSDKALKQLSASTNGMPAVTLGTLRSRHGRVISLRVNLTRIEEGDVVRSAGGSALLNEHEWAMLGRSADVSPVDVASEPPSIDRPGFTAVEKNEQVITALDSRADGPHPMKDPAFPLPVKILVGGKERAGVFQGNDYIVPLSKGEAYEILVENHTRQLMAVRLLVDGLNTLPQGNEVAPRVNFADARPWFLDPRRNKRFIFRGFFGSTGAAGKYRKFTVVDSLDAVAARKKFTDQIGLISAVFYNAGSGSRGVGTGFGEEGNEDVRERNETIGEMRAVVHIRYVDPDALVH